MSKDILDEFYKEGSLYGSDGSKVGYIEHISDTCAYVYDSTGRKTSEVFVDGTYVSIYDYDRGSGSACYNETYNSLSGIIGGEFFSLTKPFDNCVEDSYNYNISSSVYGSDVTFESSSYLGLDNKHPNSDQNDTPKVDRFSYSYNTAGFEEIERERREKRARYDAEPLLRDYGSYYDLDDDDDDDFYDYY